MALITLAGRSHVLGQFFDVLFPYSRKAGLQVRQFFIRQENILVTAIGVGGVSLLYLSLYLYFLAFSRWNSAVSSSLSCGNTAARNHLHNRE